MTLSLACVRAWARVVCVCVCVCVRARVCKERNAFLIFKLLRKAEQNITAVYPFA